MTVNRSNTGENFGEARQKEVFALDYKRIIFRALQRWYFVVLSIAVALVIAFIENRYSARIYPVTASIIIKETEDTGGGEILYKNALIDPYKNYLNELYIIRSYPLVQSVVEDLNFGSTFFREGNILTSELYDFPVIVKVLNENSVKSANLRFTVLSDQQFRLEQNTDAQTTPQTFNFADTISFEGISMVANVRDERAIPAHVGQTVVYSFTAAEFLASTYVGKLTVDWAEEGSGVMYLSATGTNPQKERDFLYGVIKRYQTYDLEKKNRTASRTIEFINEQLGSISDSLKRVENILERFKESNVITDISNETSRLYQKIEQVDAQKADLIIRDNYYKYLRDYIKSGQSLGLVILPSSIDVNDGLLSTFLSKMIEIENEMQILTDKDKMNNPLARDQKARLDKVKENILEALVNQEATDKIRKNYIDQQIKALEQQLSSLPSAERKYVSIQRNYSLLENLYIYLLQKRAEASISKAATTTDIVIVNPPMAGGPISPTPNRNYTIALAVGAALPLLVFVILELLNNRVQSREDVEKITRIPFIGGIGHKKSGNNLVVATTPKSAITESFRALRSNLSYFLGEKKTGVILVTSSISGEGKTFTAINLASVVALSGVRTLIIGADLRKPKIYGDFGISNSVGLSSFLAGISSFDSAIQRTEIANLDVVVGGPVPPNPSELILTPRMDEFIAEARKKYDFIVVDSPPLVIVADGFALAKYADHIVFLVRQDYTPKHLLGTVGESYESGRLKNMSILLNDISKSGPGYGYGYGYTYGYGYGYGQNGKNGYGYYSES